MWTALLSVSSAVLLAGGAQCGVSYDAFFPWIWLHLAMEVGEERGGSCEGEGRGRLYWLRFEIELTGWVGGGFDLSFELWIWRRTGVSEFSFFLMSVR
jgi:hypothetical protein